MPGDFVGLPMGTTTGPHLYFYAAKPGEFSYYWSLGSITAATLTKNGPGGGPVAIERVDNTTVGPVGSAVVGQNLGQYLSAGGILIPRQPLTVGASYTAHVDFAFSAGRRHSVADVDVHHGGELAAPCRAGSRRARR